MNFYPFHIGDYASATRHLTWTEDAAYRRLLDVYYVRETALPAEKRQVYRLVLATTDEQREAVDTILEEFFELTDAGYSHKRCDIELAAAKEKSSKAAQSARARWGDAKQQDVAMRSPSDAHTDRNANASLEACDLPAQAGGNAVSSLVSDAPHDANDANALSEACERTEKECVRHAPKTNPKTNKEIAKAIYTPPEWVPAEQWSEFVQMRKAMRNVPFTGAAAKGVVSELDKLRGQGFDPAELLSLAVTNGWRTVYPPKGRAMPSAGTQSEPAWRTEQRQRTQLAAPGVAVNSLPADDFFIDVETKRLTN